MYLKSLVLKGFKSFADRVELNLEPGIIAVVGPNGSGKSNISDAVLWVLGERNAKNLRGQVMEDVIFAGSSARKSVRVAEVQLVLDNTDGALPVDYTEVSVARRMYRSGESEYLINGSVARRMDVLDILHDSGLGTGTNSIISQGHLDSILQSKPEDRRALIEEAAGVLKHKQRKAKSARRLEQMDQHLARVRDVATEVERQLGPLKRRANRAIAYQEATAELSDLNLQLAVDDLRALKRSWAEAEVREAALLEEVERRRGAIEAAEADVARIQEVIRREGADAESLARTRQRASSAVGGLETGSRLLAEKRRAARDRNRELADRLASNADREREALSARAEATGALEQATAELEGARAASAAANAEHGATVERRAALERAVFARQQERRDADRAAEEARSALLEVRERLASGKGKSQLYEERAAEAARALEEARRAAEAAEAEVGSVGASAAEAASAADAARASARDLAEARDAARAARDAAADAVKGLEAEIRAIEEVDRAASAALGRARAWLVENAEEAGAAGAVSFADVVSVDEGLESAVEAVMGPDANALVVADADAAGNAAASLRTRGEEGEVTLVMRADERARRAEAAREAAAACGGIAFADAVRPALGYADAVEALLGDVVVVASEREALAAHAADAHGLRFATRDGFVVWPSGKVTTGARVAPDGEGVLARVRQRAAALDALERARAERRAADERFEAAVEAAAQAEQASLAAQRERSSIDGRLSAVTGAANDARRAAERREAELADATARRDEARRAVEGAEPGVRRCEEALSSLEQAAAAAAEALSAAQDAVAPAREEEQRASRRLSDARLAEATLVERSEFARRSLAAAERELSAVRDDDATARRSLSHQEAVEHRAEPLVAALDRIAERARGLCEALESRAEAALAAAAGTHERSDEARAKAKAAHDALDEANEQLSQVRVEKSGLSVRVEAGVAAIVSDCKTPLETALELPELSDRASVEDAAFRLRRRIANMGTINPDAAAEYEQLKSRYDFLASQLADLDSARAALARIDRVIDSRMKDDFIVTFNQVNANFQEIFSTLFPGGSAELSLTDPDDLENTGVEVSAQPRGKRISKMSLMSGGEKSLVAIALLFAAYRIRSAPFYILDEVEAALDDTNLRRLTGYFQSLRETTQLILITHQRRTMEMADILFGVSMQADGVTKVLSQRLENALRYAE